MTQTSPERCETCPKCGSDKITGFRSYDTQKPSLRLVGRGEECLNCGARWKLGEWAEYQQDTPS